MPFLSSKFNPQSVKLSVGDDPNRSQTVAVSFFTIPPCRVVNSCPSEALKFFGNGSELFMDSFDCRGEYSEDRKYRQIVELTSFR